MIEFQNPSGQTVTGEVWSPGPVAQSVWVLVDGEAVAVKLPTKRQPARQIERVSVRLPFLRPAGRAGAESQAAYLREQRYAPRMSQKVWSELTADQVAPVEQTALFDAPAEDVADEVCAQCGSPRSSNRHQFSEGHSFVPSHAPAPAPEAPQERPDAEYAAGYAEDGTVQRGAWVRVRLASGRHEVAQVTGLAAYSGTRGARVDGISTHSWVPLHRITAVITNSGDVAPIEPAETSTERHLANRCREVVGEHCHCSLEYDRPEGGRRPCMVCDAPAPAPEAPQERPDAEYAAGYAEGQRARAEDGAQPVSAAALGTLDTPHARGYRAGYLAVDMAAPADAPCVDTYRCAKVVSSANSPHREDAP